MHGSYNFFVFLLKVAFFIIIFYFYINRWSLKPYKLLIDLIWKYACILESLVFNSRVRFDIFDLNIWNTVNYRNYSTLVAKNMQIIYNIEKGSILVSTELLCHFFLQRKKKKKRWNFYGPQGDCQKRGFQLSVVKPKPK